MSNPSAKKGATFERLVADCLNHHLDDVIDRRVKTGAKDCGDLAGWRHNGLRICAELKNTARLSLGEWVREAEKERVNDHADVALVIHKRHGKGDPFDQLVTLTLRDLIALLRGDRPVGSGKCAGDLGIPAGMRPVKGKGGVITWEKTA